MPLLPLAFFLASGCVVGTLVTDPAGSDTGSGPGDTADTTDTDTGPGGDARGLTGRTYVVALSDARIVEPATLGAVLSTFITQDILLGVESVTTTELEMFGSVAADGSDPLEQDYCLGTFHFPTADFTGSPAFEVGPADLTLAFNGISVDMAAVVVTGTFTEDGGRFEGGTLSGKMDTRPLDPMLGGAGAICGLAQNLGEACVACPSDGAVSCLDIVADQITGQPREQVHVVVVPGDNCEGCADGPPAVDAECDG